MSEMTLPSPVAPRREIPHTVSPGLWTLAWRRLRSDRVAMVSLAIVVAFLIVVLLSGLGVVARDWAREVGVNYAPPSFVGADAAAVAAEAARVSSQSAAPESGPVFESTVIDPIGDVIAELKAALMAESKVGTKAAPGAPAAPAEGGFVDPLADVMKEIEAQKGASRKTASPKGGGFVDPLADVMKDIEAGKSGAGTKDTAVDAQGRRATLPFGADKWGRDVIAKTIKGSETSIFVGLAAALVATFIGTVLGAFAGYYGRWVDDALNWFYNVFSSIPYLLLILAVAAVLQQKGTMTIVLILGLTGWTGMYRQVRAEFLKHSQREYVRAAEAIGASTGSRMFRHILPNVSHVILVRTSLLAVGFIKAEVILSYLGLGVPVDQVSWGTMLAEAQSELILGHWWQLAAATLFMALFVTAFSLMADALRDALDPKLRGLET